MDKEIYEKLNDIKDLNDRVVLKKILVSVFSALENYTNDRMKKLEERVFDELTFNGEKYDIFCTIIQRNKYDITDEFMYPLCADDLEDTKYEADKILEALKNNEAISIYEVYLKCSYKIFKEFINKSNMLTGKIKTNKGVYEASFKVKESTKYTSAIEDLYKTFINNNIRWKTVNNPYIHKFADIELTRCSGEIKDDEIIEKIEVNFNEFEQYVRYNMVPLWNIKHLCLQCAGFPMPCIDKVNYEHSIPIEEEGIDNGYLIESSDVKVKYVIIKNNFVVATCSSSAPCKWNLLKIVKYKNDESTNYDYDITSNKSKINYINKLALKNNYAVKTKNEIIRIINSFDIAKYVKFTGVYLDENDNSKNNMTYNVNDFLIDEIREENIKKVLILKFKAVDKNSYINEDILSFIVSEIAMIYPEYECKGILI